MITDIIKGDKPMAENEQLVFGYFYWIPGQKVPMSERIPIDSGSPEPKTYLMKQPLSEGEMKISILILEKRYPYKEEINDDAAH